MSTASLACHDAVIIGGDRLRQAAEINEAIKAIAEIARRINMIALNAMLMARQAGSWSRGFGVVSVELRQFSRKLESLMEDLVGSISTSVIDIASLLRRFQEFRYLSQAAEETDGCHVDVAALLAEKRSRLNDGVDQINTVWRDMHQDIGRALRFCQMGRCLARSAKVEAVYGGAMSGALGHVADEVGDSVDGMLKLLARLHRNMEVCQ